MPALMLQGTGSDVGKSVLVAALCRALANRGLRVRPFKPQNMSTNAAVTAEGGEIGRAQATQALACRVAPSVDMNPVLLKPQSDHSCQLVVHGRVRGTLGTERFRTARRDLLDAVLASYRRLAAGCDLVVAEGAGSSAEINLRAGDIANMGFARGAGVPVVLVGDIDRGGVIAAIVGTRAVLDPADAAMIGGFVINKFRGERALFEDGYRAIEARSGWRGLGVLPWLAAARRLPAEDGVILDAPARGAGGRIVVACPVLPHIANFDDLDPLRLEPEIDLRMIPPGRPIPPETALVVLAGSKATLADLAALRAEGWDTDILAHRRRGGHVLGLCGGYQMLGRRIADPLGLEGAAGAAEGLGLLDVQTVLGPAKRLGRVAGTAFGAPVEGYLMHFGRTEGADRARAPVRFGDNHTDGAASADGTDGAASADGRVVGTYVHGLFGRAPQRRAWLARFGADAGGVEHSAALDAALEDLAQAVEAHLDIEAMLALAASPGCSRPLPAVATP